MTLHVLSKRPSILPTPYQAAGQGKVTPRLPLATILVIDDDVDMMRIMMHTLAVAGYRALPARGGLEALRQLRATRPDLVVTDLTMSDMSGVEVIARIKRDPETGRIPVLAVTASQHDEQAQSAGLAGCDGYVGKPLHGTMLLSAVERALARSRSPYSSGGHRPDVPPDLCA